jgi:hypothetical protein
MGFCLVFGLTNLLPDVHADSSISVIPDSANLGKIEQGQLAATRFQLHNSGTRKVTIRWMDFSSPGLIAQVKSIIPAGSSVEVLVNWNTSQLEGEISGTIVLGLDDPENPEVSFTLKGTVVPVGGPTKD